MAKVIVYHQFYGCDTGCCGHIVEMDGKRVGGFEFIHPSNESEAEAKAFARSKLDEGLTVYAGTINPHTPKQLVPSSHIYTWIAAEQAGPEPRHGEDQD